jgi:hypothetical protein
MLLRVICIRSPFGLAPEQSRLEHLLAVARISGVEDDARLDDLVDPVERRGVEDDVSGRQLAVELLHRPGTDDRRGDAWVVGDEGDRQLDERQAGVVGDLGKLLDRFELALVLGQRRVEALGQPLAGRRDGELSAVQLPDSQPPDSGL